MFGSGYVEYDRDYLVSIQHRGARALCGGSTDWNFYGERERGRERGRKKERERMENVCVCVCVQDREVGRDEAQITCEAGFF